MPVGAITPNSGFVLFVCLFVCSVKNLEVKQFGRTKVTMKHHTLGVTEQLLNETAGTDPGAWRRSDPLKFPDVPFSKLKFSSSSKKIESDQSRYPFFSKILQNLKFLACFARFRKSLVVFHLWHSNN